jgi:hypothetical protein
MRIFATFLAFLLFLFSGSTYAQSCYSGSFNQSSMTVYPQTFTTVHTVNVPVQVQVQHQVQTVVQQPLAVPYTAPLAVPQCQQSLGAVYGNSLPSCGSAALGVPFQSYGVARLANVGGYGNSFNSFQSFNSGFGGGFNNAVIGNRGVSIIAQDRKGTQVQAVGTNNVRINRGLLGRINGASADRRGGLGGLLPF